MFRIKDAYEAFGIKPVLSAQMQAEIDLWEKCYSGKAPWLSATVPSLRLEKAIAREFSTIVLNEMTAEITNNRLKEIFDNSIKLLGSELQHGLSVGEMIIKPFGADKVEFVHAGQFIPIEYDAQKRLKKVIFPDIRKIDGEYYTRLEYHAADLVNGLTIINKAFRSNNRDVLGKPVPLNSVDDWANIAERMEYPLMLRPAFGHYRNPIDNDIDNSAAGVSVFGSALNLIRKADEQFGRLDWEFESAERKLHVDPAALKDVKDSKSGSRLYVGLDLDEGDQELYEEFSPTLRQADFISGLEEYKRNIEFAVGLSYGDISNPQTVAKTATEIKTAKDRKYNTVTAIQENLRDCLDDFVYALAFYNSLTQSGYEFICDFKDSILTDEETERKQDIQDLQLGILRPEEYRAKWRSEDLETARANLPKTADVLE